MIGAPGDIVMSNRLSAEDRAALVELLRRDGLRRLATDLRDDRR